MLVGIDAACGGGGQSGTTYIVHVGVRILEPLLELFVVVCIVDQGIGSVEDDIHDLPVGKALKKRSEFSCGGFETAVLRET
jgi:hypothetical protein